MQRTTGDRRRIGRAVKGHDLRSYGVAGVNHLREIARGEPLERQTARNYTHMIGDHPIGTTDHRIRCEDRSWKPAEAGRDHHGQAWIAPKSDDRSRLDAKELGERTDDAGADFKRRGQEPDKGTV